MTSKHIKTAQSRPIDTRFGRCFFDACYTGRGRRGGAHMNYKCKSYTGNHAPSWLNVLLVVTASLAIGLWFLAGWSLCW